MKSGNLNFLEPSGPLQACNGTALPLHALFSEIYFWNKTLHVSDSSCVHYQEFFAVHTAHLYDIPLLCVQWKSENGQRNCPKHVEFYFKNKFQKLVHLVGFIIRIFHDAWSPERQKLLYVIFVIICIFLVKWLYCPSGEFRRTSDDGRGRACRSRQTGESIKVW